MSGVGPVYVVSNNMTPDIDNDPLLISGRGLAEIIIIGVILAVLDLTTVLGNLLVYVTIVSNRRLRNTTNYSSCR